MKIAVPREVHANECRVASTPDVVEKLIALGFEVSVESDAGARASFSDQSYQAAGATIVSDTETLWREADIILKVRSPETHPSLARHESDLLHEGQTLLSFIWPAQNPELMAQLAERKVTVLALDSVPRISRAQKLDALSSMANIGGYRAVIEAANNFGRFFTGQITAAGKVPPAKVMVIGAGVAGLSAIGTAMSLGAIVRAFDTRPEVKEQIESMGAQFLELDFKEEASGTGGYAKEMSPAFIEAEMALFRAQAAEVDIIITTALIPGKPAPKLILADMVEIMRDGSVIVDMAAEQGGNCELTVAGEITVQHGVKVIGYVDLPSRLAAQSSQLYGTNLRNLLTELCPEKNGEIVVNMEDEVIRGTTVIKDGEITWPPPAPKLSAAPQKPPAPAKVAVVETKRGGGWSSTLTLIIGGLALWGLGSVAPPIFMSHFTVFVLACFIGYQVIWNVTPALHTPLMSVTNAISGIIVLGAVLQVSTDSFVITLLAGVAILIASINIAGGFLVTQRMLRMFQR
ncbi:MAG: NAD(P) transhydrogenase subunit alpha [Gammaproteobacteria bacterium]|jgi:NAD(P) transhydrogenase subunit alpha